MAGSRESSDMKAQRKPHATQSKGHLLVVEDEQDLRELLSFNFIREGYRVTAVESGEKGLEQAEKEPPDLMLLDLMLPGIDGLDVCRRIRASAAANQVPIIMLTAKGEEADIVAGLELGADDYVTKPFSPRVLIARVKAVLRRRKLERAGSGEASEGGAIQIEDLVIMPDRHEVRVGSESIELTATEFKLLSVLARRPGRVFTRKQLINLVHGELTAVTDRSVDVQVVTLRRKLGNRGQDIQTVRGVGYRFRDS